MTSSVCKPVMRCKALAAILAFFSVACSDPIKVTGPTRINFDDGASDGVQTAAIVNAIEGGTLALSTGALVEVPAGAVDEDVELGLRRPPDEEAYGFIETIPDTQVVVSAPYVVTPHGMQFKEPVQVVIPMKSGADLTRVMVAFLENEEDKDWETLGIPSFNSEETLATIDLTHFSVLILVENKEPLDGGVGEASDSDASTIDNPSLKPNDTLRMDGGDSTTDEDPKSDQPKADAGVTKDASASTDQDASAGDAGSGDAGGGDAGAADAAVIDGGDSIDGGTDGGARADAGTTTLCGNGVLDTDEACDPGIDAGQAGACPTWSDCTSMSDGCSYSYVLVNQGACYQSCELRDACTAACGDGVVTDPEMCDTAIPPGEQGACPTTADCEALNDSCTTYALVSQGACYDYCEPTPICL